MIRYLRSGAGTDTLLSSFVNSKQSQRLKFDFKDDLSILSPPLTIKTVEGCVARHCYKSLLWYCIYMTLEQTKQKLIVAWLVTADDDSLTGVKIRARMI